MSLPKLTSCPQKSIRTVKKILAIFAGKANVIDIREAIKVADDRAHDVAVLRITGQSLPSMSLGNSDKVREGETYAFTGYPTGMVLGLNAVTHRGIISAITPIVIPQLSGQFLEKRILSRLIAPYDVFQLDATAIRVTAVARFTTPKQVR